MVEFMFIISKIIFWGLIGLLIVEIDDILFKKNFFIGWMFHVYLINTSLIGLLSAYIRNTVFPLKFVYIILIFFLIYDSYKQIHLLYSINKLTKLYMKLLNIKEDTLQYITNFTKGEKNEIKANNT
jgi:hypothetical protein